MKINIDFIYPIGTIYETTSTVHPNVLFGGTWEEYGRGRVTVGLYPTWTETSYIGQMGGEKEHILTTNEIPSHNHANPCAIHNGGDAGNYRSLFATNTDFWSKADWNNKTADTGGGQAHNNMQPYIVVYRYRRIA